jgi:hypothetical protein
MKKLLPFAIAALMIPSVALAKGPNPNAGTHSNHGKATVMYVLKGTIYGSAYNSTTSTPGSVTVTVTHSNRHGKLLVGQTIPIPLDANSKVVLENGATALAPTAPGDQGMVKIRAPKMAFKGATSTALQTAMQNRPAHMVIDMGAASSS